MTTTPPSVDGKDLDADFATLIGRVAAAWSSIEMNINLCVWELSQMTYAAGACVTSQMTSLESRLRALLSLLKLRGAPQSLIDLANKFAADYRGPINLRNRIVHDLWIWNDAGEIARLEIDAPKKLSFEMKTQELEKVQEDYATIRAFAFRCVELKRQIFGALSSLPDIRPEERYPIRDHLLDQQNLTTLWISPHDRPQFADL